MRGAVRALVARRLSEELAERLLPRDPAEPDGAARPLSADDLSWSDVAAAYPALLDTAQRKQRGAWFTCEALAAPTAARALAPLLQGSQRNRLRIVDPAVGGGTFLIAALRELLGAGMTPLDAALCLHGVDTDSTAAALAALALWSAADLPADALPLVAANVRHGDGLIDLPRGTFDAVLTNPPWETLQSGRDLAPRLARLRQLFRHQGRGKLYTYRLFVERTHQLLRDGGRFGLIVPASLWFDRDAAQVRDLLLDECRWEWLFGFENRKKLFAIDSRYRFAVIVGEKGGTTQAVKAAFGRSSSAEWAQPAPQHTVYERGQIARLSPHARTLIEIDDARDLDLLSRMQTNSKPLLGTAGRFVWRQGDFNMTGDRDAFVARTDAEAEGYRLNPDARWRRRAGDDELLPLYQGAMVYDLHPNTGAHARGSGFATTWQTPLSDADLRPAYLLRESLWEERTTPRLGARIVLRTLSNATNERTAVCCLLPEVPCGNSLGVLVPRDPAHASPLRTMAAGAAMLGSLAFDWALRLRLSGTNLNGFVLGDCRVPELDEPGTTHLAQLALRLCAVLPWQRSLWRLAREEGWEPAEPIAETARQRAELMTHIDVLVGRALGLGHDDVRWIVRGCDLPSEQLSRPPSSCHRRGFWRIDREVPPPLRRPNRWLAAALGSGHR